jgi:hypothetical protein
MRTLFWNPQIERVATLDGDTAPDGFAALQAVLRPDGTITDRRGAAIRGPFVALDHRGNPALQSVSRLVSTERRAAMTMKLTQALPFGPAVR